MKADAIVRYDADLLSISKQPEPARGLSNGKLIRSKPFNLVTIYDMLVRFRVLFERSDFFPFTSWSVHLKVQLEELYLMSFLPRRN